MTRRQVLIPVSAAAPFRAVTSRRTYEEAVEQITEAVRMGDFPVGSRLPSERTLADLMDVSRPTVREAIKVLADVGVLETKSGGGTTIKSDIVPSELLARRTVLRFSEVAGVLEARRLLEPRVAQLAARYLDDEDVLRLEETIDLLRRHSNSRDRFILFEVRFHLAIAKAAKNTTLVMLTRSLFHRLEIVRDMAMHEPQEAAAAIAIHERTLAAICSGDVARIDAEMDEHLAYLERLWTDESGRALPREFPDYLRSGTSQCV